VISFDHKVSLGRGSIRGHIESPLAADHSHHGIVVELTTRDGCDRSERLHVAANSETAMRVRVQQVGLGISPHDIVVEWNTVNGPQWLVVDDSTVEGNSLAVGYPLRRDDQFVYVALPKVTTSGSFRVWVPTRDIVAG